MVVSVKIGSWIGIVVDGLEVVMGKIGGIEIGTETGGGDGGWERTCISGVGERGRVSP